MTIKDIEKMNFTELIEEVKMMIKERTDPDHYYFYIDDNKDLRLEKLLGIENSFLKNENNDLTDFEEYEIIKRNIISQYYGG